MLALDQGDLAQFSLGRQRVLYLSSVELIEAAFVGATGSVGKWGRCRRWWLRRPAAFVEGELFSTHVKAEHTRARRHFNPALNRARSESDSGRARAAIDRICTEQAACGGSFDLSSFVQTLLLAGMCEGLLDRPLTLAEAETFVALRNRSKRADARIFSSTLSDLCRLGATPRTARDAADAARALHSLTAEFLVPTQRARPSSLPALVATSGASDPARFAESLLVSLVDAPALLLIPLLELARDEALAEAVRAELNGTDRASTLQDGVAMEGIRLGAGWLLGRRCQEDFRLGSVDVRRGDWLLACPHLIHRDDRYWPDAGRLLPARWFPEEIVARPRYSFLSFGLSNRICPGRHAVAAVVSAAVAALAADWRIQPVDSGDPPRWVPQPTGMDVELELPLRATIAARTRGDRRAYPAPAS